MSSTLDTVRGGHRIIRCVACGGPVEITWPALWPFECDCGQEYTPQGRPSPEPICPGLPPPVERITFPVHAGLE